jgi:hypothetical protein
VKHSTPPNHPAPGKAGITPLLASERICSGLPEPSRWTTLPMR